MTPSALFDLTGRTALVTGGATGIGRMAAEAFAAAGAHVFVASRKAPDADLPPGVEGIAADLGSQEGIDALSDAVKRRTDRLDILMNNAGRTWGAPLDSFPRDGWADVLAVNLTAPFMLTQALLPLLEAAGRAAGPARVVNTGSIMGEVPMGDGAYSYAASKAGLHHITRILAKELAPRGITVNALAPGPFETRMTVFAIGHTAGRDHAATHVPLGRIGTASDIAGAVLYLCGPGGAYVTGAILPVSGGLNVATGPALFGEPQ